MDLIEDIMRAMTRRVNHPAGTAPFRACPGTTIAAGCPGESAGPHRVAFASERRNPFSRTVREYQWPESLTVRFWVA